MRVLWCVTAAVMLAAGLSARADVVETFNVSGTFTDNTTMSGTIMIDTTTGVFESGDISYLGMDFDVIQLAQPAPAANAFEFKLSTMSGTFPLLDMGLAGGTSLVGYSGGTLCSLTDTCNGSHGHYEPTSDTLVNLEDGAVTVATPEPSSVALLGTGLLGFAVMMRRRFLS